MPEMSLDSAAAGEFSHAGGDVFDFKAMEESEAAGSQVGKVKLYICPADVVLLDGDGRDDLAIGGDDATQSGDDATQSGDDADINIGVGELQECTISKSDDGVAVDDLIINAVISEADYAGGDAGTKGSGLPNVQVRDLQLDQNLDVMAGTALPSVTDLILDPYNPQAGEVGDMDSFAAPQDDAGVLLGSIWGGIGSEAYQSTQQRWDSTAASDSFDFKASEPTTATKTYYDFKMEDALISSWSSSGASETGYNDGVVDAADYVVWRNANADTVDIDLSLLGVDTGGIPVSLPEYAVMLI